MRRIYKFLDVDQQQLISNKLYEYVTRNEYLSTKWGWLPVYHDRVMAFIPELQTELSKIIDSKINMITILRYKPHEDGPVHLDVGPHVHRVLWPVHNCQGSYTKFYNVNGNKIQTSNGKQRDRYLAPEDRFPLKEIDGFELTQPVLFNTKVCHRAVINKELTEPRITCTIGFENPNLEDILMA